MPTTSHYYLTAYTSPPTRRLRPIYHSSMLQTVLFVFYFFVFIQSSNAIPQIFSSQWNQINLNNNINRLADAQSTQPDSIRDLIELKTANKDIKCRADFCFNKRNSQRPPVAVCATDGKTYDSKCVIKYLRRCNGQRIRVKHLGRCGFPIGPLNLRKRRPNCQKKRSEALRRSKLGENVPFIPSCRKDGRFRRIQCSYQLNHCFCVRRKTGIPLSGTGVKLPGRPRCKRKRRKGKGKRKSKKRRCTPVQRATFNNNMLQQFEVEFNVTRSNLRIGLKPRRNLPITGVSVGQRLGSSKQEAAEWKFSELDSNHDGSLSYKETKALRRITRLNIKPRRCARRFFHYCDSNNNRKVDRQEWSVCFGLKPRPKSDSKQHPPQDQASSNPKQQNPTTHDFNSTPKKSGTQPAPSLVDKQLSKNPPPQKANDKPNLLDILEKRNSTLPGRKVPTRLRSCEAARQDAIRKNKAQSNSQVFVPKCMPDGRFAMKQCYSSNPNEKLCFCMDPDTGSVLKQKNNGLQPDNSLFYLNCDVAHLQNKVADKNIRGCAISKRTLFRTHFIAYLVENTRDRWVPNNRMLSTEFNSLSIRFAQFDTNKDGFLSKKEKKAWRRDLMRKWGHSRRHTKKCARHFASLCDANDDSILSMQEMTICLGIRRNM